MSLVVMRQRFRRSTHSAFANKISTDLNSPSKTDIATCNQFLSRQHFSTFFSFLHDMVFVLHVVRTSLLSELGQN